MNTAACDKAGLARAFDLFNENSGKLEASFAGLSQEVERLKSDLGEANASLNAKVSELDSLSRLLADILDSTTDCVLFVEKLGRPSPRLRSPPSEASAKEGGRIRFANRAARHLFGLPGRPAGLSAAQAFGVFPGISGALEDALARSKPTGPREDRLRVHGGDSIPVTVTVRPFPSDGRRSGSAEGSACPNGRGRRSGSAEGSACPDGRGRRSGSAEGSACPNGRGSTSSEGAVVVVRDLTEARALERAAKRNTRLAALGRMAAQLSHEFRNVVAGLEGMSQLLVRDFAEQLALGSAGARLSADTPTASATATNLRDGLHELNDLVGQMLEFSRPAKVRLSSICLEQVLARSIALEKGQAPPNGFHVAVDVRPEAGIVRADDIALRQVLVNLLRNAREAMPDGGKVGITAALQRDGRVRVTVDDEGPGIPRTMLDAVFDPFLTTKATGTGLGLANCLKLMEAQNGSIEAATSPVGGARFILELPGAPTRPTPRPAQ